MLMFGAMSDAGYDNSKPGSSSIQFGTAEYAGAPAADRCKFCQQPIAGTYYRLQGAMACRNCVEQAHAPATDSHADYMRGLVYGIGAAIAGLILYATFEIATGLIVGYVSLAVGWMVGKATMKGSNGHGGRRYQITAALLTYAAVSMAAIPIWIHYASGHHPHASQQQRLADEQRSLEQETGRLQTPESAKPAVDIGKVVLQLALVGLASPFLELADPLHGLIGLFILFIGIRIAWQSTRGALPTVDGPFQYSPRSPA